MSHVTLRALSAATQLYKADTVFGLLKAGDHFTFDGRAGVAYVKGKGGWYRRAAFLSAQGIGRAFRTGPNTAVFLTKDGR